MAVLLSERRLIVRLLCHDSDADDGRVLMSLVYAPRLGGPAVNLICFPRTCSVGSGG